MPVGFLSKFALIFNTVRYLRPLQAFWQVVRKVYPISLVSQHIDCSSIRWTSLALAEPVSKEAFYSKCSGFVIQNLKEPFDKSVWKGRGRPRLWQYNLHYFEYLRDHASGDWGVDLINSWIEENPIGARPGWEPYTISLRLVNWCFFFARYPNLINQRILASMRLQGEMLIANRELHLGASHLWSNGKALLFLGGCVSIEDDRFEGVGKKLVSNQLKEHVLADGGHYERSPMYHSLFLEDVLDLLNLALSVEDSELVDKLSTSATEMLGWLAKMTHPDGFFSFFNDTTLGVAAKFDELKAYSERLGVEVSEFSCLSLSDSGFRSCQKGDWSVFCDVGEIGPKHQPGHAHAGTLSFELSVCKERFIVNSGISTYEVCEDRLFQRGTSAHSTVCVSDINSSEVWSSFRVGRRCRVNVLEDDINEKVWRLGARIDGFYRGSKTEEHTRGWTLSEDSLRLEDFISVETGAEAVFYLHPNCTVERKDTRTVIISSSGVELRFFAEQGKVDIKSARWFPGYNVSVESSKLVCSIVDGNAQFVIDRFN